MGRLIECDELRYLEATRNTNRAVEFCDGRIEALPFPTTSHQRIVCSLTGSFWEFTERRALGEFLFGIRVKLRPGLFRVPDVVFMLAENSGRIGEEYWDRADLVTEVVSPNPKDRERDLVEKRAEYAGARIAEYWIVDEQEQTVTVLALKGKRKVYSIHGEFKPGDRAGSVLLKGFEVDVANVFAAARRKTLH